MIRTRAALLMEEPGKWEVVEAELDPPGEHEVLVPHGRIQLHSDDHVIAVDPVGLEQEAALRVGAHRRPRLDGGGRRDGPVADRRPGCRLHDHHRRGPLG